MSVLADHVVQVDKAPLKDQDLKVCGDPQYFYDVRMIVAQLAHDFDLASEGFEFLGCRLYYGLSLVSTENRVRAVHNLEHHLQQSRSQNQHPSASTSRTSTVCQSTLL